MNNETNILMLPPEQVAVTSNIRFALKPYRVQLLAERIMEAGEVHTPLKIEPLPSPGPHGELYTVREGHYRKAAVELLNKKGAGLELPCIVEEPLVGVERIKRQISENNDRENLSPIEMGIAIKALLDENTPKVDIRKLFPRPGGRKGNVAMQDLSNSMLNIYVSFLEFPKNIQKLIHDGRITIGKAMKLYDEPRERWAEIVEKAEAERLAEIDAEEKRDTKLQEAEAKAIEQEAKAKADAEALVNAQKIADVAKAEADAKVNTAAEAFKAKQAADKDSKKQADEHFKAAEADAKAAQAAADKATKEADKLKLKAEANAKLAAERATKLAEARKAANKAADSKKLDTDAAAAALNGGKVKLKGPEIIKLLEQMALPGSFPKVQKIFAAVLSCINSDITDAQLTAECGWITGERKQKPGHVKG